MNETSQYANMHSFAGPASHVNKKLKGVGEVTVKFSGGSAAVGHVEPMVYP
jgi:hypothetical protein